MKIAFTSMGDASLVHVLDTDSRRIMSMPKTFVIEDHRPFGLTWSRDKLFLAQPTSLLQLNRRLRFEKVLLRGMWYGTHQIAHRDGVLWMVCPRLNAVQRYDLGTGESDYFFPDEGRVSASLPESFSGKSRLEYAEDGSHYNSILLCGDRLYLSAHNHELPSFVAVYELPSLRLLRRHGKMGRQIHNLAVDGDEVFTLDSLGSRCVVSTEGANFPAGRDGQFLRGLAVTREHFVYSRFPYETDRERRKSGSAEIVVMGRDGKELDAFPVRDCGNINDLRLLDEPDLAHGEPPFWGGGDFEVFRGILP